MTVNTFMYLGILKIFSKKYIFCNLVSKWIFKNKFKKSVIPKKINLKKNERTNKRNSLYFHHKDLCLRTTLKDSKKANLQNDPTGNCCSSHNKEDKEECKKNCVWACCSPWCYWRLAVLHNTDLKEKYIHMYITTAVRTFFRF